jgi:flavodoxin
MKSLVIYDSVFGNTEQIALSIGNYLGSKENVAILQVSAIKPEQLVGLDLLIVGSPTRAFRPTKAISSFLNKIPSNSLKGIKVAAFDTRMSADDVKPHIVNLFMKLFGYAAKPIADKLKKKGGDLLVPPEGFFVKDSEGPLKDNELERAANWAKLFIETQ